MRDKDVFKKMSGIEWYKEYRELLRIRSRKDNELVNGTDKKRFVSEYYQSQSIFCSNCGQRLDFKVLKWEYNTLTGKKTLVYTKNCLQCDNRVEGLE